MLRVVVCCLHAAATTILPVGICFSSVSAITFFASNGTALREPQAGLCGGAHISAVPARARGAALANVWHPVVRSVPILPLWELTVNGVPRLRLDQVAVTYH